MVRSCNTVIAQLPQEPLGKGHGLENLMLKFAFKLFMLIFHSFNIISSQRLKIDAYLLFYPVQAQSADTTSPPPPHRCLPAVLSSASSICRHALPPPPPPPTHTHVEQSPVKVVRNMKVAEETYIRKKK